MELNNHGNTNVTKLHTQMANYTTFDVDIFAGNNITGCFCPKCDGSNEAGYIALAVIIGIMVGIVGTLVFLMLLRRFKPLAPPPKDYDPDSALLQTSREEERGDQGMLVTGGSPNTNKPHKKLERLIHRNTYQDEVTMSSLAASAPLLPDTAGQNDSNKDSKAEQQPKKTDEDNVNTSTTTSNNNDHSSVNKKVIGKEDSDGNGVDYINVGQEGLLQQPYDSLAPESDDGEYVNQPQDVYEPIQGGSLHS